MKPNPGASVVLGSDALSPLRPVTAPDGEEWPKGLDKVA